MASKSIYQSYLFSELQEGRIGFQCERSLRVLLYLLDGWQRHSAERIRSYQQSEGKNPKPGKKIDDRKIDNGTLPVIYFDKFAMLSFRIWDEIFSVSGAKNQQQEADPNLITFPSPFQSIPGKHGPGPGRFDNPVPGADSKGPIYLVDLLYELQNSNLLHYFELNVPPQAHGNPKHHRTTVSPSLPVSDTEELLKDFNEFEREVLRDLRNGVKRLKPSEIRALGTHANHRSSVEDINREFKYLKRHRRAVIEGLRNGTSFYEASYEMLEFAEEASLKSSSGRKGDYSAAFSSMRGQINNSKLQAAFLGCQRPPDEIWDTSASMRTLVEKSAKAEAFTKYLNAVSFYQDYPAKRTDRKSTIGRRYDKWWKESLTEMNLCGLSGFPSKIEDVFVGYTNKLKHDVRERLITALESF